jgi:hypothetical protein
MQSIASKRAGRDIESQTILGFPIIHKFGGIDTMGIDTEPNALSSESKRMTKEELLAKAYKPAQDAMKMHPFYKGKLETSPKCCIRDFNDFAIWYTPGVAAVCKDIYEHPE